MTVVARMDVHGDWKPTTLSAQLAAGATSLAVQTGGLDTWTPVTHGRIPVVINRGKADEEHLYATGVAANTLTGLVRGQDDTADQAHGEGATVEHGLFAEHIGTANEFLSMPTAKGDLPVAAGPGEWARQGAGADGSVLVAASGEANGVGWTDDLNLAGGSLILPQAAAPGQTAEGSVVWDADDDELTVATGTGRKTMVDTDSDQTLENKTFTAPVIANFVQAQHDHGDGDDGGALATAAPTASAVGDAASTGATTAWATATHRHARESFGSPAALSTTSSTSGAASSVARSNHNHAWPDEAPRGAVGYTAAFTVRTSTGAESAPMLSKTANLVAGRLYEISASARVLSTVDTDNVEVRIKVTDPTPTTFLADADAARLSATGGPGSTTLRPVAQFVPVVSGDHVVTAVVVRTQGSGTVTAEAGNGVPALLIKDVGLPT